MKKGLKIILSVIVSLVLTLLLGYILNIYHFNTKLTSLSFIYLFIIFSIILYLILSVLYLIKKKTNNESITVKLIISICLSFVSLCLILFFIFDTNIAWLNHYSSGNSAPFYLTILKNILIFILPSLIIEIISIKLFKSDNK